MPAFTPRHHLSGAILVALVLLLSACGGGSSAAVVEPEPTATSAPESPDPTAAPDPTAVPDAPQPTATAVTLEASGNDTEPDAMAGVDDGVAGVDDGNPMVDIMVGAFAAMGAELDEADIECVKAVEPPAISPEDVTAAIKSCVDNLDELLGLGMAASLLPAEQGFTDSERECFGASMGDFLIRTFEGEEVTDAEFSATVAPVTGTCGILGRISVIEELLDADLADCVDAEGITNPPSAPTDTPELMAPYIDACS